MNETERHTPEKLQQEEAPVTYGTPRVQSTPPSSAPSSKRPLWLWGLLPTFAIVALAALLWWLLGSGGDTMIADEIASRPQESSKNFFAEREETKLSYGIWTGEFLYDQPHGSGTLKYTQQRLISQFDPEHTVARPGDYIIGEFDNGQLLRGKLYRIDGTTVQIDIVK